MYRLVTALVLSKVINSQWRNINIIAIPLSELFTTYRFVYVTLTNPYINDDVYVNLFDAFPEAVSFNADITVLLANNGNKTIPTVSTLPTSTIKYASYSDASVAGYNVNLYKINAPANNGLIRSQLTDAILSRPNYDTDLTNIHTHALVTVNGFFHRTDTDGTNAFIYDAGSTLENSDNNSVGIHSFINIGTINKITLQPSDITFSMNGGNNVKTYIKVNEDITNKTVMLVLGGYLVLLQADVFYQVGQNLFILNWCGLPILERYYDSKDILNLSSLGLDVNSNSPSMINIENFFSESVLTNYLTLSQSFLVIIDNPNIFTQNVFIRNSGWNKVYTAYNKPTYAIFGQRGRVLDYFATEESGQWTIDTNDNVLRNYSFSKTPLNMQSVITDTLVPSKPGTISNACGTLFGSFSFT